MAFAQRDHQRRATDYVVWREDAQKAQKPSVINKRRRRVQHWLQPVFRTHPLLGHNMMELRENEIYFRTSLLCHVLNYMERLSVFQ